MKNNKMPPIPPPEIDPHVRAELSRETEEAEAEMRRQMWVLAIAIAFIVNGGVVLICFLVFSD